ncbi:MAG TPA: Hsp20/alpha crystallin family protein [Candidatus Polarisedimenticolaceae bacterium]|nr:Hsp20/alpha crystallin family protein [Candidatus Polarisedimenticolaceae bacterium]
MAIPGGYDPLHELQGVQKRMNDLFESALAKANFDAGDGLGAWSPVADVFETGEALVVYVELPGLEQAEIGLRLEADELVVEGERKLEREGAGERFHRVERSGGRFARRFRLPSSVDRERITATYKDGVLRVVVPTRGGGEQRSVPVTIR